MDEISLTESEKIYLSYKLCDNDYEYAMEIMSDFGYSLFRDKLETFNIIRSEVKGGRF